MDFISQIPDGALQKTEIHPCRSITLFKPLVYLGGIKFHVTDYHIVIPSENTPAALFNNQMIRVGERKVLAVNPGDTVDCLKGAPAKPYYSFLIKPNLINKLAEEIGFPGTVRFESFLNPFSIELFRSFRNLEQESGRPDRLNLFLDSLEIQIATFLLRDFKTNMKTRPALFPDADSYIQSSIEYIRAYFSSNLTLQDICGEIHVSPYHFIRTFKQKIGITPHKYLLMVRMEKAKELLDTNQYTIAEAATLCGFESVPHFPPHSKNQPAILRLTIKNFGTTQDKNRQDPLSSL